MTSSQTIASPIMEASGESGVHMEPAEDDIGSDHSQETAFSQTADLKSNQTLSAAAKKSTDDDDIVPWMDSKPNGSGETHRDGLENETVAVTRSKKRRYPYGPLFFIMTATAGQRYTILVDAAHWHCYHGTSNRHY